MMLVSVFCHDGLPRNHFAGLETVPAAGIAETARPSVFVCAKINSGLSTFMAVCAALRVVTLAVCCISVHGDSLRLVDGSKLFCSLGKVTAIFDRRLIIVAQQTINQSAVRCS